MHQLAMGIRMKLGEPGKSGPGSRTSLGRNSHGGAKN
jgi:hypothetical protein